MGVGPNMWPNPDFVEKTLESFPEKAVANVEEGRVSARKEEKERNKEKVQQM